MSLLSLVTTLKTRSQIQSSDGISDSLLESFLTSSLAYHNPTYTWDTLPVREEELVILLAWIMVCETRAAQFVNESDLSSSSSGLAGGYGQDRNTPFNKNMALIKYLKQRYSDIAKAVASPDSGMSSSEGQVVLGTLYRSDDLADALVPLQTSPVPSIAVSAGIVSATNLVLKWSFPSFENYHSVILYKSTAPSIREEWNHDTVSDIPEISSEAERLIDIRDQSQKAIRVINLSPSTQYYFLAVLKTNSFRFSYSNELALTTGA